MLFFGGSIGSRSPCMTSAPPPPAQSRTHRRFKNCDKNFICRRFHQCWGNAGGRGEFDPSQGDRDLQDQLVDQIQIGIAKAKVKEDMLKDLEERKERLRAIGDDLTDELDKQLALDKARMNLASSSSLADTMEQFKQLDEDVQRIRDELQADKRDLAAFEKRSADERSKGLFFKGLYTVKDEEEAGQQHEGSRRGVSDPEADERRRVTMENVKEPARRELRSPGRLALFTYLTIVLAWVIQEDISLGEPDLRRDALYGVLCAILGFNAWNERTALVQDREVVAKIKEQDEQQEKEQERERSKDDNMKQ